MIKNVVAAWDGSPASGDAVEWAARYLGGKGTLRIVRIFDTEVVAPDYETTQGDPARTRAALELEVARAEAAFPELTVTGEVISGPRDAELGRLATPDGLLVLGRPATAGPRILYRLSVITRIAALAQGPVAVIPHGQAARKGLVIVGIDGTPSSIAAALLAADLASDRGTRLVALHVWQEPTDWTAVLPISIDLQESLEREHRAVLESSLAPVREAYPGLEIEKRVLHTSRHNGVVAQSEHASVLVVGKHGRTSFREALLGSVSQTAVLTSHAPVLIAGAAESEEIAEEEATAAAAH